MEKKLTPLQKYRKEVLELLFENRLKIDRMEARKIEADILSCRTFAQLDGMTTKIDGICDAYDEAEDFADEYLSPYEDIGYTRYARIPCKNTINN